MRPVSTSCADHMGSNWARIHTWDGSKWVFTSDWLRGRRADPQAAGQGHGRQVRADKKLTPRTPATASPDRHDSQPAAACTGPWGPTPRRANGGGLGAAPNERPRHLHPLPTTQLL